MLAGTRDRLDWLKMAQARGRYLGMELDIISVDEAAKLFPLMDKKHFVGAMYDPDRRPCRSVRRHACLCQIRANRRRRNRPPHPGDRICKPRPDGSWDVITDQGNVHAEHVVNAAGLWAREVGRMVGIELPILAMEHQYLITGDMPELAGKKEQLHAIDFEGEIYLRQERGGMLMGTYERAGVPWSPVTTPWDFGQDLLPNDLERIAPSLEVGFEHFPALGKAGIKKVVNGPFTFAPDGNPLVGPDQGAEEFLGRLRRHGGLQSGRRRGPGAVALDGRRRSRRRHLGHGRGAIRRLDHAWPIPTPRCARTIRAASASAFRTKSSRLRGRCAPRRFTRSSRREHAVFGDYCALEHPLWFAPTAEEAIDEVSFRRSNSHPHVAAECRAVRDAVGLLEISNYGKFEVSGPGAVEWLSRMMANRCPPVGRIALTPMLNERGKLIGDFTMCRVVAGPGLS